VAERVHGPYEHRPGKWRVVVVGADGVRANQTFTDRAEAQRVADQARAALGHRSVGAAVTEYLEHMGTQGLRPSTVATARYRLVAFLRCGTEDRPLASLTPAAARALYSRRSAEVKPDTHRGELALASTWATWCVRRGYLAADPFADVEPTGARSAGGDCLRVDEARRFLSACLGEDSHAATACALALLTGARASEITDRVVRDLDDGGRLLWIPSAKTAAGVRQLAIPELLRGRVLAAAKGKGPTERLWGSVTRHWLGHHVRRLCEVAKVPVVSPHDLRRSYATLRVGQNHAATEAVARELGQAGAGVTRRHYLAPGTEQGVQQDEVVARISATPNVPDDD
jgi:integrase